MRYLFIVSIIFAVLLEASTYRSIRVNSFGSKNNAEKALIDLQKYIASQEVILKHQKKINFHVQVVKVGNYYMNVIEPFKDERKEIQEIVDIIRLNYSHVYVRKVKTTQAVIKESLDTNNEIIVAEEIIPPKLIQVETNKTKAIIDRVEEIIKNHSADNEKIIIDEENSTITPVNTVLEDNITKTESTEELTQEYIEENSSTESQEPIIQNIIEEESDLEKVIEENATLKPELKENTLEQQVVEDEKPAALFARSENELVNQTKENSDLLWQILLAMAVAIILFLLKKVFTNKNDGKSIVTLAKIEQTQIEMKKKSTIYIDVIHELKSNLTSVVKATKKGKTKEVEALGLNALNRINDILDSQAMQEDKFSIKKSKFNTKDFFNTISTQFDVESKESKIKLDVEISKEISKILIGDKDRLNQIIFALLKSFIKDNNENKILLTVNKIDKKSDVEKLEISFLDSSKSMDAQQIDNLLDNELSITNKLISKIDASLNIKAKKDAGTEFILVVDLNTPIEENKEKNIVEDTTHILSVDIGIQRCDNDKEFYNSMLEEFKSMFDNSSIEVEKLCNDESYDLAQEYVIEIKDFAMNIGAYKLSDSLDLLHYELKKSSNGNYKKLLIVYVDEYKKLTLEINKQLK